MSTSKVKISIKAQTEKKQVIPKISEAKTWQNSLIFFYYFHFIFPFLSFVV